MRLNKYIATSSGLSRRAADEAIAQNRVLVNGQLPSIGAQISDADTVTLDNAPITPSVKTLTIMLNKPHGYVVAREGQGNQTVYDLLPSTLWHLKPVGRLDKQSEGLLLLTTDGQLAYQLTHPRFQKRKIYEVRLDQALAPLHRQMLSDHGIQLEDGLSILQLDRLRDGNDTAWQVMMHEGRNRQIRRSFAALGYEVVRLRRTQFGDHRLGDLPKGAYRLVQSD